MRVLITEDLHPYLMVRLAQFGCKCDIRPKINRTEILDQISDYEGLVVATRVKVDRELIDAASNLKWVARAGSGMENIDVSYAESKNISCVNSPDGNCDAVGEHAVGLLLNLLNYMRRSDLEMRSDIWLREANRGHELGSLCVGIVGFGHTGKALAQRLAGFGCSVLAYDVAEMESPFDYVEMASLERIQEEADVLSLHLPLNPSTKHLVNKTFLNGFRKPIWLLNTSRGPVVKTSDLITALQDGRVHAAGLDVFEHEKIDQFGPVESKWWQSLKSLPNVILTPHVAGWTFESKKRIAKILSQRIYEVM
jgi:D-3-phosphoglycerate dehydrogenase